jgi:hypothetical protein
MRPDRPGEGLGTHLAGPEALIRSVTLGRDPKPTLDRIFVLPAGREPELSRKLEHKDAYTLAVRSRNAAMQTQAVPS